MKFQYATFRLIIFGNEIFTGSLTGSEPEITIFDRMGDFPSLEQGSEIRPGRIKSYRIRGRILYDQYEYE